MLIDLAPRTKCSRGVCSDAAGQKRVNLCDIVRDGIENVAYHLPGSRGWERQIILSRIKHCECGRVVVQIAHHIGMNVRQYCPLMPVGRIPLDFQVTESVCQSFRNVEGHAPVGNAVTGRNYDAAVRKLHSERSLYSDLNKTENCLRIISFSFPGIALFSGIIIAFVFPEVKKPVV